MDSGVVAGFGAEVALKGEVSDDVAGGVAVLGDVVITRGVVVIFACTLTRSEQ